MRLRSSLRISRGSRRGYTVAEIVVASALLFVVLISTTAILSMAGGMQQSVSLQTDADQVASRAMNRMILEIREAKDVQITAAHQIRVFYPVTREDGHYDRFVKDPNNWIDFYRADAAGHVSSTGKYLQRCAARGSCSPIATDVKAFVVERNSANSVRITLKVESVAGTKKGSTQLTERVLYLRNS
jgi:hypothetical protein